MSGLFKALKAQRSKKKSYTSVSLKDKEASTSDYIVLMQPSSEESITTSEVIYLEWKEQLKGLADMKSCGTIVCMIDGEEPDEVELPDEPANNAAVAVKEIYKTNSASL